MTRHTRPTARHALLNTCALAAVTLLSIVQLPAADPRPVTYNRDIRPLLSDRCFHCHGPDEGDRQAELRLDRATGAEGAYREAYGVTAIKPGSIEESELWNRITSTDPDVVMPPPTSHKKALTVEEQQLFREWILQGGEYENYWAFVPPEIPSIPKLPETNSVSTNSPIDQFVFKRLAEEGLQPQPTADRRTLIRRLTLDLTGLPPTRDAIEDFLADDSPDAHEKQVDRLLDSPHYGEHMAKYWLDLVRFADTNGIHHDHYRDMSPYRDWVIRSFNDNLPYDDFVRYQIAGDLYDDPRQDQLIASGFHRLHLIIDRGTMLPDESFSRNVNDRVSSVGTAFLGMTFQCAVCHDHKYDPITAKDFYSLAGFFNNIDAEPETGGRRGTEFMRGLQAPYINLPSEEQQTRLDELAASIQQVQAEIGELKNGIKGLKESFSAEGDAADQTNAEDLKAALETRKSELSDAEKRLQAAQKANDDYLATIPAAMIMKERSDVRPSHILIRGAYDNLGQQVERATPAFLPPMKTENSLKTRMDLANWLVDADNPLTARVAVNRFWQQLFGTGIVRTAEDFGAQGEWPSHPDLLDYLTVRFVDGGWDMKALMKEMVMSHTYQQSSNAAPESFRRDPANRLLTRGSRYRMDSEMIRDQILATSGILNTELFGKSVKPPQPEGLWKAISLPSSYPREYDADSGDKIYRRSLYTFWKRAMPPPQMSIFNAPSREECIARRERTNTPLQALLLLNETEYLKAARHLASHALATESDNLQRLSMIYETITAQLPDQLIQKSLVTLVNDLEAMYAKSPELAAQMCADAKLTDGVTREQLAAWAMVASTVYNLDITKTRQ